MATTLPLADYYFNVVTHEFAASGVETDDLCIRLIAPPNTELLLLPNNFNPIKDVKYPNYIYLRYPHTVIAFQYNTVGEYNALLTQIDTLITPGGGGGTVTVTGVSTASNQTLEIGLLTDINTVTGTQADAAIINPATNASIVSYIRGILTRLASGLTNWTSLFSILPAALSASGNFKVAVVEGTISATVTADKVTGTPVTTTFNATTSSGSSTALAANASRKYLEIQNTGNQKVYVGYGVNATTASKEILAGQSFFFEANYIATCEIRVLASSGTQVIKFSQG